MRVKISDHHMPGAGMSHHRNRHNPYGTSTRDEHIFAQYWKRQGGMHSISKGAKDSRSPLIDCRAMSPDIGHGKRNPFGKGTGTIDADSEGRPAKMPSSPQP